MGIWKYSGLTIKTESIRKLSNFNNYCQWAKTLCQIISIILHSVLPFSRAIKFIALEKGKTECNTLYEITTKTFLVQAWENQLQKLQISLKEILHKMILHLYLCFLNSCEIWNLFSQAQMSILLLSHKTPPMASTPGFNMWCIYLLHGVI